MGVRAKRGLWAHLAYLAEACVLLRRVRDLNIDHIHAHFGRNSATVAMLSRMLGGTSYSFTVHGPEEFDEPTALRLRDKIHRARFVAAVSEWTAAQLQRWCHATDRSRIEIVRCGVDDAFLSSPETPPPAEPALVCVGRLCVEKNQQALLAAVAQIAREHPTLRVAIVGDGPMRAELERYAAQAGIGPRVRFTGRVGEEQVRREMLSARALVLPSIAEGLPVVIMEAYALHRPVVATFVAGIPELVQPGRSGWLVPAGSVEALAAALREVLEASPEDLLQMAREGRRRVCKLHDVRASAAQLAALFEGC
jgi:glycosyltransferase involved in cell wall biosynthesis